MGNEKIYTSKVDWWLALIIILLLIMGLVYIVLSIVQFVSEGVVNWWNIGTGLGVVILIVFFVWPIYYTLEADTLLVRSGLLRSKYKYSIITGAKPSHNPLASPSLSLDRIKITYRGLFGFFLISPKNKEEFMKDLASRADHLEYVDGEVRLKQG